MNWYKADVRTQGSKPMDRAFGPVHSFEIVTEYFFFWGGGVKELSIY